MKTAAFLMLLFVPSPSLPKPSLPKPLLEFHVTKDGTLLPGFISWQHALYNLFLRLVAPEQFPVVHDPLTGIDIKGFRYLPEAEKDFFFASREAYKAKQENDEEYDY